MGTERKPDDIDQEIRINELRESARELAGGEMTSWESKDSSQEITEQFWRNVIDYEQFEQTCHLKQLAERGIELPAPQELSDELLSVKLWEVIDALAALQVFLYRTDHLSDRELYTLLWEELLLENTADFPPGSGWTQHLDILGGCSDEDLQLNLKYYADEEERERWRKDWPEDVVPERAAPPFDRDRRLPKSPH
jgi:hypothetical protein